MRSAYLKLALQKIPFTQIVFDLSSQRQEQRKELRGLDTRRNLGAGSTDESLHPGTGLACAWQSGTPRPVLRGRVGTVKAPCHGRVLMVASKNRFSSCRPFHPHTCAPPLLLADGARSPLASLGFEQLGAAQPAAASRRGLGAPARPNL